MAKHAKIDIEKLYEYSMDNFFKYMNDLFAQQPKENANFEEQEQI